MLVHEERKFEEEGSEITSRRVSYNKVVWSNRIQF